MLGSFKLYENHQTEIFTEQSKSSFQSNAILLFSVGCQPFNVDAFYFHSLITDIRIALQTHSADSHAKLIKFQLKCVSGKFPLIKM